MKKTLPPPLTAIVWALTLNCRRRAAHMGQRQPQVINDSIQRYIRRPCQEISKLLLRHELVHRQLIHSTSLINCFAKFARQFLNPFQAVSQRFISGDQRFFVPLKVLQ